MEIQWEPKVAQMKCLWFCEEGKARWEWGVPVKVVVVVVMAMWMLADARHITVPKREVWRHKEGNWRVESS